MTIEKNISLLPYNTFHIDAKAQFFARTETEDEIREALNFAAVNKLPLLIINGGSNMLFLNDFNGLVILIRTRGIEIIKTEGAYTYVRVAAGENWDGFVHWCIGRNLAGIENLAFIPGNAGAAPVQNLGAYGVEVKDVIDCVETIDIYSDSFDKKIFSNADCRFAYRDSIFKNSEKGKQLITHVVFKLKNADDYTPKLDYGNIRSELKKQGMEKPTISQIANVVTRIRTAKLPDPAKIGNSGSFFQNPYVSREVFENIMTGYPDAPSYDAPNPSDLEYKKIPAAWLIEKAGYKGFRRGDAGVSPSQPLVLVNYGTAGGKEIYGLCREITGKVQEMFGVKLQAEVNLIE